MARSQRASQCDPSSVTPSATYRFSLVSIIYAVSLLDMLAAAMVSTLLSSYLKDEVGVSATLAGIIGSVYGVVQFFSGPIVGGESDIRGCRQVLVVTLLLCVPAYLLLCIKSIVIVALARLLAGSVKHTQNLLRTVIGSALPQEKQLKVFGRINAMGNVGFIVGPAFAGYVTDMIGYEFVFALTSLIFLLNALLTYFYFPKDEQLTVAANGCHASNGRACGASTGKSAKKTETNVWKLLTSVDWPRHWDLMLSRFLLSITVMVYRSNMNWFLKEKFGADKTFIGYLTSYQGVVAFLSAYYTKSIASYFENTLMFFAYINLIMCFGIAGLVLSNSLHVYSFFIGLLCVCSAFIRAVSLDIGTERCKKSEIGLIMGVSCSVVSAARAFSPALGGLLHDISIDMPPIVAALCALLSYLVTVWYSNPLQKANASKKLN